jgi:hypothetical protein
LAATSDRDRVVTVTDRDGTIHDLELNAEQVAALEDDGGRLGRRTIDSLVAEPGPGVLHVRRGNPCERGAITAGLA